MSNTANVAQALAVLIDLTTSATNTMALVANVSALIAKAQAEGRDLTPEDWAALDGLDDAARVKLAEAIAKAS